MGLIRSFLGIPPPQDLRERIGRLCAGRASPQSAAGTRWISPANYHLTLVFLGATPEERVPTLRERLSGVVAGFRSFRYALRGPVAFPDSEHPRVLALLPEDPAPFCHWQGPLATICRTLGFTLESRPFRPHLSLARTRRRLAGDVPCGTGDGLVGIANSVVLYHSHGGAYEPLFTLECPS